jgi:hypothetical protein
MTRETKLGIGVATSFLSLVAVVAYSSWNKTEAPPPMPEAPPPVTVAQVQSAAKNEPKAAPLVEAAAFKDGRGGPASPEPSLLPVLESGPGALPGGGVNVPVPPPGGEGIKPDGAVAPTNPANTGQAPQLHPQPPQSGAIAIPPPTDLVVPAPGVAQPKAPALPSDSVVPSPQLGEMTAKGPVAGDPKLESGGASALPSAPLPINTNPPPGYPTPPSGNGMPLPANPAPAASNPNPLPVSPVAPPTGLSPLPSNPIPPSAGPTSPVVNPNPLPPTNPNPLAAGGGGGW